MRQRAGRRLLIAALLVALLAVGLSRPAVRAAAAPWWQDARFGAIGIWSRWTQPVIETADFAPIRHTSVSPYGINTFLHLEVEEAKRRRTLAMIRAAGFHFVREEFPWQDIERLHKGGYLDERHDNKSTWELYDTVVDLVDEYGLELIARLDYPPDWSKVNPHPFSPPDNLADFGDFVETVVTRYRGKVRYFQIWNEPNLAFEWGEQPADPAAYVRLLRVASARAKAANPDAVILAAALAPTLDPGPLNMNDLTYLRRMYEAGAKGAFDVLSVNPYGLRAGPDDRRFAPTDTNFSRPILARQIMVEFGDTETPIWASELGWNALPDDFGEEPVYGRVTREQQARYTVRAYERAAEEWPWLGVLCLWDFKPVGAELERQQATYFGIVDAQFQPFPVYTALAELANRPPILQRGQRQEDHPALHWSDAWTARRSAAASLGGDRLAVMPGATVSFSFEGTALALLVRTGPDGGRAAITIDGSPWAANQLPKRADGRAYLETYAPTEQWQQTVPVAERLARGRHSVTITVAPDHDPAATANAVAIDAFIVASRPPPDEPTAIALVLCGLAGWIGWIRARRWTGPV